MEAVRTTRASASALTGGPDVTAERQSDIWVIQVSGDHYACDVCSRPAGATSPQGDYLRIVVNADGLQGTDGGPARQATDLAALGDVQVLRD